MKHHDWFAKVTSDSVRAVARTVGLPPRTLATQLEKGRVSPENVIAISAAYGAHPVRALVDTGYLDPQYARAVDPATAIQSVSEEQLAEEVLRRMRVGVTTENLILDVNEVAERLTRKPAEDTTPVKPDLHAVKEKNGIPYTDDGEPDYDAIVDGINAGTEKFAAQRATEPLEEHWP